MSHGVHAAAKTSPLHSHRLRASRPDGKDEPCHAANIAIALDRKVNYDIKKHEFTGDEQANRLRSEALREPWRI